jgi:hypothetical protein
MHTALTAGSVPANAIGGATLLERISRRTGLALLAWSRTVEHRRSREYLAELHERRREAERLRDEMRRDIHLARGF